MRGLGSLLDGDDRLASAPPSIPTEEFTAPERERRVEAARADELVPALEPFRALDVACCCEAEVRSREELDERVAVPIGVLTSDRARLLDSALPLVAVPGAEVARLVDSPLLGADFSAGRTVLVFALMGSWSRFKVWLHPLPILAEGRRSRFESSRVRGGHDSINADESWNRSPD